MDHAARGLSSVVTDGIRVDVRSKYLPERSSASQHVFAYTVRISNEGTDAAQLHSRHWVITDAQGAVREVVGEGVVGAKPFLHPGESFEYTSGCVLETPHGSMQGTYTMYRPDGTCFDAAIAPFVLAARDSTN